MRVLYIYNPQSAEEKSFIEQTTNEMKNHVESVEAIDFQQVKDVYRIRSTPALVIIRDDLQGEQLRGSDAQLRIIAEVQKSLEEEEKNMYQQETHRLDHLINQEKIKAIDDYTLELIDGGII